MNNIPTLFGFPLWFGKIKRRVAKKYINKWTIGRILKRRGKKLQSLNVGDYIHDCTGFNGEITEMQPWYFRRAGGWILFNLDLTTTNTGCSLIHCGITEALSKEVIEKDTLNWLKYYLSNTEEWFGADGLEHPRNKASIEKAKLKVAVLESGGHITDEFGQILKEYK